VGIPSTAADYWKGFKWISNLNFRAPRAELPPGRQANPLVAADAIGAPTWSCIGMIEIPPVD
jgi:hypothetical protein